MRDDLTFEDGVLLCRHIYQSAINKTLNGVIEQDQILFKAHDIIKELDGKFDHKRLDELLFLFNLENVYSVI